MDTQQGRGSSLWSSLIKHNLGTPAAEYFVFMDAQERARSSLWGRGRPLGLGSRQPPSSPRQSTLRKQTARRGGHFHPADPSNILRFPSTGAPQPEPGFFRGIIRLNQRPYQSSYDMLAFDRCGENDSAGLQRNGDDDPDGRFIRVLGDGRIEDMIGSGDGLLRFDGERVSGQETRSEISAWNIRRQWVEGSPCLWGWGLTLERSLLAGGEGFLLFLKVVDNESLETAPEPRRRQSSDDFLPDVDFSLSTSLLSFKFRYNSKCHHIYAPSPDSASHN